MMQIVTSETTTTKAWGYGMAKVKGRKRKDGKRRGGGRLAWKPDPGGDELRAHRKAVTGSAGLPSDYPLAVLRGRGWLDERQYVAGMSFAALSWRLFGKPFAGTAKMEPPRGKVRDPAEVLRDRRRYEASVKLLHDTGAKVRMAVEESAVSLRFGWCVREIISGAEITDRHRRYINRLVMGLDALKRMPPTLIDEDEAEQARMEAAA